MYFRIPQRQTLLTVKDNYAHLVTINDGGNLEFEFTYSISQKDAVAKKAMTVRVTVATRQVVQKPILGTTRRGQVDTASIVDNVRTAVVDAKSGIQQQLKYQVATRTSDISATINNEVLPQLRAGANVRDIPAFNKPRLTLVSKSTLTQANNPQPLLQRISNVLANDVQTVMSSSTNTDPRALMHDLITRQGIDPSQVLDLTPRVQSEHATRSGFSNPEQKREYPGDPATSLLHFYLFPPHIVAFPTTSDQIVDTDLVQVLQTVSSDNVDITVPVTMNAAKLRLEGATVSQVFVTFDLIDGTTNLAVDTVTKNLDVSKHIQVYHTPKFPPSVKSAPSEISSRVNLEVKQIDPGATEVEVYKKAFWIASPEVDDYTLIGTYSLSVRDQSLLIQVDQPRQSPVLYRVIPRGKQSVQSFEFSNVAIKPAHYSPVKAASVTAQQVDTGIQVEIRHLPTNCVAVQFLRWNMTTFDDAYTTIGTDVGFIDDATRQADLLVTIDSTVAFNNIYRYQARLIYSDGHTADYGDATLEFIQPSPGQVDTKIANLVVSHDASEPNVAFDITTSTIGTDMDAVKQMLENQGLKDLFTGELQAQRDQLANLIAHSVYRVDLNTGSRESFGVLTTNSFDDNALRKNLAIKALEYGHKYRYEIYPLLRAPETMFDSLQRTDTDPVTKKPYTWSPAKFRHPFTLSRGVIVTTAGAKLRHAKDPMTYGTIGSITTVEASFDTDSLKVTDASAANFDRYLNVVTWKVLGDLNQVDHFLVLKQVHGIRTLIGKTHSEFTNGSCQYIHPITIHDQGSIQYVIIPVYNDYRVGLEALTNTLIVEAP